MMRVGPCAIRVCFAQQVFGGKFLFLKFFIADFPVSFDARWFLVRAACVWRATSPVLMYG